MDFEGDETAADVTEVIQCEPASTLEDKLQAASLERTHNASHYRSNHEHVQPVVKPKLRCN